MFKYEGAKCPVCHAYLMEEDDIVVCPDCGAPHHRECWKLLGHCGCEQLHENHEVWKMEEPKPAEESPVRKLCPACHSFNEPGALFCSHCGSPMQPGASYGAPQGQPMPYGAPNQSPFGQPPYGAPNQPQGQPFGFQQIVMDPLGGVDPEELLDEVPAKELAEVVGNNSAYYLSRFKPMSQGKKMLPNFMALFFAIPWMFYRKMNWQAVAVLLLQLALAIPTGYVLYRSLTEGNLTEASFSNQFWMISNVCSFLQMALNLALCFFANRLYYSQCLRVAKEIRGEDVPEEGRAELRKKRGGVNTAAVIVWAVLYGILYLFYFYFTMLGIGI